MAISQFSLFEPSPQYEVLSAPHRFEEHLRAVRWGDRVTEVVSTVVNLDGRTVSIKTFVNQFWTSQQRAAHSLHEVSYRACFKPQLPRFFIERLSRPGDVVYDPFMGRGTTLLEAALLTRVPVGCDINPVVSDNSAGLSRAAIAAMLHDSSS